jgi:hypothetical protein
MSVNKFNPIEVARQFLYVRESGANSGNKVEAIQKWCGGLKGESWCCYFATMVLDICFQGTAPIPRLGACQSVYDLAIKNGWVTTKPIAGDIFLYVDSNNHAHHIGIITVDGGGVGIAGNTSEDGTSSNGDRVAEHSISTNSNLVKYVHYPRS